MNSSALSWDDLRFFLHVGRAGSLTGAAQTMAVSHATAFRHLQRLEAEIGVQLFNKTRAGYSLTSAGEDLMQVARNIETEVSLVSKRLAHREAWPGGLVRLTTTDTLMHHLLAPILKQYQSENKVQIELSTSIVLQNILKGDADVALRAGGRPPEPLVGRRICKIESSIYYHRQFTGVNRNNLHDFPWIAGDDGFAHLDSSKWWRAQGLDASTVIRTNSHVNILNLVKNAVGLAVLPCYLGDLEPSICRLMPPVKEWRSDLWLLTRVELRNVPRIKKLFDAVYQGSRVHVPLFEGLLQNHCLSAT